MYIICICISSVGLPLIIIKKTLLKRNPQVIPQSNIFAISNTSQEISPRDVEECENDLEMETFHNSRIINIQQFLQSQISNETEENQSENQIETEIIDHQLSINPSVVPNIETFEQNNPPQLQLNNCKYNKNLVNLTGVLMFVVILYLFFILMHVTIYHSWSVDSTAFYLYVFLCFASIGFPLIYFLYHPKHLINVLKELHFL